MLVGGQFELQAAECALIGLKLNSTERQYPRLVSMPWNRPQPPTCQVVDAWPGYSSLILRSGRGRAIEGNDVQRIECRLLLAPDLHALGTDRNHQPASSEWSMTPSTTAPVP
jgi:hypothetical protein